VERRDQRPELRLVPVLGHVQVVQPPRKGGRYPVAFAYTTRSLFNTSVIIFDVPNVRYADIICL
jgi:hypothetical protein